MASSFSLLPAFSLILIAAAVFPFSGEARPGVHFHPCNTLTFSTYSFSLRPQNPNDVLHSRRPAAVFTAELIQFRPDSAAFVEIRSDSEAFVARRQHEVVDLHHQQKLDLPFSLGFSSLKDRTKDILNVVASLLLGAACGALTAGTMYIVWSMFNGHSNGSADESESDEEDDDLFNPKKKGYVTIPAAPGLTPAGDSAPVKESA